MGKQRLQEYTTAAEKAEQPPLTSHTKINYLIVFMKQWIGTVFVIALCR